MSKLQIGQLQPNQPLGLRDAFHVACVLVKSDHELTGSDPVRFTDTSFTMVEPCKAGNSHALVDPFLNGVRKGEQFFVLLKPGTISERLTHHFDINVTDVPKSPLDEEEDEYDECRGCW